MFFNKNRQPEILLVRPGKDELLNYTIQISEAFYGNIEKISDSAQALSLLRNNDNYRVVIIGDNADSDIDNQRQFIKNIELLKKNELIVFCITYFTPRFKNLGLYHFLPDDHIFDTDITKENLKNIINPHLKQKSS